MARIRVLGVALAAAALAMVGAVLGLPVPGPSPPAGVPVVAADRSSLAAGSAGSRGDVGRTGAASVVPDVSARPESGSAAAPERSGSPAPRPSTADPGEAGSTQVDAAPSGAAPAGAAPPSAAPSDAAQSGAAQSGASPAGAAQSDAGAPGAAPSETDRPARGSVLAVRRVGRLGSVVVDAQGFTLYRFDGDSAGSATCTGACVSTWPPATVEPTARMAVQGIETADIGLIRRPEGTVQLTLGGWPVYRFAGDDRPGQDGGHGIGGAWSAVTPTGGKARTAS